VRYSSASSSRSAWPRCSCWSGGWTRRRSGPMSPRSPGILIIIPQQIVDHLLNAWGWKFAFNRRTQEPELLEARSNPHSGRRGQLPDPAPRSPGGRAPAMLGSARAPRPRSRASSSPASRSPWAGPLHHDGARGRGWADLASRRASPSRVHSPMAVPPEGGPGLDPGRGRILRGQDLALRARAARFRSRPSPGWAPSNRDLDYFLTHPGRFLVSTLIFTTSYFWGRRRGLHDLLFMGVPATCAVALTIEVLSSVCDGLLFMVPAKIGRRRRPKRRSSRASGSRRAGLLLRAGPPRPRAPLGQRRLPDLRPPPPAD